MVTSGTAGAAAHVTVASTCAAVIVALAVSNRRNSCSTAASLSCAASCRIRRYSLSAVAASCAVKASKAKRNTLDGNKSSR
jgi:hypothetical protein